MEKVIPYLSKYKSKWYADHREEIKQKALANKEENSAKRKQKYEDNKEKMLEKQKIYRENNKEKVAKAKAKCYQESKEEYLQKRKEYYQQNKEKICANVKKYQNENKEFIKERNRKKLYGIEPGTYDKMMLEQDNKCCICHIELDKCKQISIDHCHTTGDVRGLLCSRCNLMLGMVEDNTDILESAIKYLSKGIL